jgi:hypothetical protein
MTFISISITDCLEQASEGKTEQKEVGELNGQGGKPSGTNPSSPNYSRSQE